MPFSFACHLCDTAAQDLTTLNISSPNRNSVFLKRQERRVRERACSRDLQGHVRTGGRGWTPVQLAAAVGCCPGRSCHTVCTSHSDEHADCVQIVSPSLVTPGFFSTPPPAPKGHAAHCLSSVFLSVLRPRWLASWRGRLSDARVLGR